MANPIRTALNILGVPDVSTAEKRATAARQAVIDASKAVEAARAALSAADESGQGQDKAEAALIAAERAADRATRTLSAAESKLEQARSVAADELKAAGKARLDIALDRHQNAARRAGEAVRTLAECVAVMDKADEGIAAAQREGVASPNAAQGLQYGGAVTRRRLELALIHAGALSGAAPHDLAPLPEWSALLASTARS